MVDYQYKTPPFEHQAKVFLESRELPYYALLHEMGCVTGDTEYLTPRGWKAIKDYCGGPVAQYTPETGHADFVQPTAYIAKRCTEPMLHFNTPRGLDQVLSRDHTVLWYDDYGNRHQSTAGDLAEKHLQLATGCRARLPGPFLLEADSSIPFTDAALRVQVAVAADGHFPRNTKNRRCYMRLKKERKVQRMRRLLAAAGIAYVESACTPDGFRLFKFDAPERQKTLAYWGASLAQRRIIAEEVVYWDGSVCKSGGASFYSRCKETATFVQFCFVSTGRRASFNSSVRESGVDYTVHAVGAGRTTNFYSIGVEKANIRQVPSPDGKQYCFTVPSGFLVLRYNGSVFCTGNCGKSKIIVDNVAWLYEQRKIDAALIVAPNGVSLNWVRNEIPAHLPDRINRFALAWDAGNRSQGYTKCLVQLHDAAAELKIFAVNVEALSSTRGREVVKKFVTRFRDRVLIAVDESSRIKSLKAKRTKFAMTLRPFAPYRRILTGTPVTQSPLDVFTQLAFLDPKILGFTSWFAFRNRYATVVQKRAVDGGGRVYKYEDIVGYKNLDELQRRVASCSSRITKAECLDLPEKIFTALPVKMTPEQARLYRQLADELVLEVEGTEVPVVMVLTRLLRLQQLTGGHVVTEDGTAVPIPGKNPKLDVLLEDIEDLPEGESVIIWARFVAEIEAIAKALREKHGYKSTGCYYGATRRDERADLVDRFQDKRTRFFVGNPQAAGMGLTLTAASTVYYFSNDFSLENRLQSIDRCHRIGQKRNVVYKDLVCIDTVDERVLTVLLSKKDIADVITGDGVRGLV